MSASVLLVDPKFPHNVGAAIRAASCFGATDVRWTGDRFGLDHLRRLPREERMKGYADVTWRRATDDHRPLDPTLGTPVAVELVPGSENLVDFVHPDDACYVFGPEDGSLPRGIRTACHRFVTIPSFHCTNLAAAIYLVLYDRVAKRHHDLGEPLPSIEGEARGWWHSPSIESSTTPQR